VTIHNVGHGGPAPLQEPGHFAPTTEWVGAPSIAPGGTGPRGFRSRLKRDVPQVSTTATPGQ
jgi:hypothetical protein